MTSLDQHLTGLDEAEARDEAIELLAEQLSAAATAAIGEVARASTHEFEYKLVMNSTNGSEEFNDMFYSIAEKLIKSVG